MLNLRSNTPSGESLAEIKVLVSRSSGLWLQEYQNICLSMMVVVLPVSIGSEQECHQEAISKITWVLDHVITFGPTTAGVAMPSLNLKVPGKGLGGGAGPPSVADSGVDGLLISTFPGLRPGPLPV